MKKYRKWLALYREGGEVEAGADEGAGLVHFRRIGLLLFVSGVGHGGQGQKDAADLETHSELFWWREEESETGELLDSSSAFLYLSRKSHSVRRTAVKSDALFRPRFPPALRLVPSVPFLSIGSSSPIHFGWTSAKRRVWHMPKQRKGIKLRPLKTFFKIYFHGHVNDRRFGLTSVLPRQFSYYIGYNLNSNRICCLIYLIYLIL